MSYHKDYVRISQTLRRLELSNIWELPRAARIAEMRKRRTIGFLLAIVVAAAAFNMTTDAQIRPKTRPDAPQRGINRPPFGVGQQGVNRARNPNVLKRQQLQQRVLQ